MKTLFIIIGTISLILGIVGVVLPLLPTTPFLLLSATLYLHSSPRLYTWLISSKYLGEYIRDYQEHRAIPLKSKIIIISLMWISLIYGILHTTSGRLWLQILLGVVGVAVSWHIFLLKTKKH